MGNQNWLSASEFYQLLSRIPSELAFYSNPDLALGPALKWLEEEPGRTSVFPAREILGRWTELRSDLKERR